MSVEQSTDLDELLTSPEFYRDPYPAFHRLRAEAPVHWSDAWGGWVLTRYDDIEKVLRDFRHFTKAGHVTKALDDLPQDVLAKIGPPMAEPLDHAKSAGVSQTLLFAALL